MVEVRITDFDGKFKVYYLGDDNDSVSDVLSMLAHGMLQGSNKIMCFTVSSDFDNSWPIATPEKLAKKYCVYQVKI
jgi:hypothetical protein